jgi:hypothetical protein
MAKMRMLQPKIAAMRERLGDDKQRQSQEMMALYKAAYRAGTVPEASGGRRFRPRVRNQP